MSGKQKGFSIVEGLLIFVVVGILGFTGWFVWNSQRQTNETLDNAAKDNSAVITSTKTPTTNNSAPTATTAKTTNYLSIKQWGVKFEIPSSLSDLQYTVSAGGVYLDSNDLVKLAGSSKYCELGSGYLGAIDRVDPSTTEIAGMVKIKQIGNYAYWYGGPQQACLSESAASMGTIKTSDYPSSALQSKVVDAMPDLLKTTLVAE